MLLLSNSVAGSIIRWMVVFAGALEVILCFICLKCNTVECSGKTLSLCLFI